MALGEMLVVISLPTIHKRLSTMMTQSITYTILAMYHYQRGDISNIVPHIPVVLSLEMIANHKFSNNYIINAFITPH